jgi:transcriptional regulator with XRE-family HTH domain
LALVEGDLQRRLGENLRALRQARQLSQEGLADALGIHRTYVGGLERGERNVTLRTVERLAALLEVDAAALLAPVAPPRTERRGRHGTTTGRSRSSATRRR